MSHCTGYILGKHFREFETVLFPNMTKLPMETGGECLTKAVLSILPKNLSTVVLSVHTKYAVLSDYTLKVK